MKRSNIRLTKQVVQPPTVPYKTFHVFSGPHYITIMGLKGNYLKTIPYLLNKTNLNQEVSSRFWRYIGGM